MKTVIDKIHFRSLYRLICIVFLITVLSINACKSSKNDTGTSEPKEKKSFRIAVVTWVGHGPFYLAKEKGFYDEEGLDVEINKIEEIGARRSALEARKLEGIISSADAFANAAPAGLPAVLIMKLTDSFGADGIVVRKTVNSIKDLKGKTVAFSKGTPSHFFLYYILKKNGMSTNDIIPQYMEAGDAGTAFIANKVDAAVTWEPWLTQATKKTDGKILITSKEVPGILIDAFLIREDVAEIRGEDVKGFIRAWFKAVEYWKENPEESNKIMAESLGVPIEDFMGMLAGDKFSDYKENLKYFGTNEKPGPYYEVFRMASKAWLEEGLIDNKIPPEEVTELSFLWELYE